MTDLIPTRVHNLIIVDESGSMECIRKQAFTGMNETLQTVRMMQKKYPNQLQYVTLITFDSDHTKLHYDNTPADQTKDIAWKAYNPCRKGRIESQCPGRRWRPRPCHHHHRRL